MFNEQRIGNQEKRTNVKNLKSQITKFRITYFSFYKLIVMSCIVTISYYHNITNK